MKPVALERKLFPHRKFQQEEENVGASLPFADKVIKL